ncbi:arsenate reductase ArsC [Marisediminicola sp. LYQ134]|uniref:arsenate reductase ArsC n=1 Tax=unclassified Marisediminicola TaxID=2618316 RepID=UPI0039832191
MSEFSDLPGLPGLVYPEDSLKREALALAERYRGVFAAETVERYVLESYTALLRTSTVKAHLIANTKRFAADRLEALATATGATPKDRPQVLFVCEQNAGRSQMAAVLAEHLSGGQVVVRSAGSMPASSLHAEVVEVMTEIGLDIEQAFPKPLTDDVVQAADVVITMGCGDACPVYPGKRYLDWSLTDPAGLPLDGVRVVRDDIEVLVRGLLEEMGVEPLAGTAATATS